MFFFDRDHDGTLIYIVAHEGSEGFKRQLFHCQNGNSGANILKKCGLFDKWRKHHAFMDICKQVAKFKEERPNLEMRGTGARDFLKTVNENLPKKKR